MVKQSGPLCIRMRRQKIPTALNVSDPAAAQSVSHETYEGGIDQLSFDRMGANKIYDFTEAQAPLN